jgi:F-type H+-transporting ATPase subunit O
MLSRRAAVASVTVGRRGAHAIALKYSNAVYSAALARSPQTLDKVQTELNFISTSVKDTPEINAFIYNPTLSFNDRKAGLSLMLSRAEGKKVTISDITRNLLSVLSENGRLGETQSVIEGFNGLVAQYKGELTVAVTSAFPLPKDIMTKLETTLTQSQTAKQAKILKVSNKACISTRYLILC